MMTLQRPSGGGTSMRESRILYLDTAATSGQAEDWPTPDLLEQLESPEFRHQQAFNHPMLERQYRLRTPEIESLKDVIFDWVVARKSGLYAWGAPRQGKTTAIDDIIEYLMARFPRIVFLRLNAERSATQVKSAFARYLLESFGYDVASLKKSVRPDAVLANYIMDQCVAVSGRQCVLLIDEAHLFSINQYRYLLEIGNSLHAQDILLCVQLIGQRGLTTLRTLASETDQPQVKERYFVLEYEFGGVKTQESLAGILAQYDDDCRFPPGSVWAYSRYFLRTAYDHGWRLAAEAPYLWQALCQLSNKKPAAIKRTGFKLTWIIDAIHTFLLDNMKHDGSKFGGSVRLWEDCIQAVVSPDLLID